MSLRSRTVRGYERIVGPSFAFVPRPRIANLDKGTEGISVLAYFIKALSGGISHGTLCFRRYLCNPLIRIQVEQD